mmetsp:Transcript_59863/g.110855  ORF Transcript_59863/g.110855 Transcript_59863/m.110855 type:complete len:579 (-) Transcript_59863:83-1819(-)
MQQPQEPHEQPNRGNVPDFAAAEAAAEAVVEAILQEGAEQLYDVYLQQKSFSFATHAIEEVITSELQLCFVPHDAGEQDSSGSWQLESEPPRCVIDTWARCMVPVRKTQAPATLQNARQATMDASELQKRGTRRGGRLHSTASSHFSSTRLAQALIASSTTDATPENAKASTARPPQIPLVEEWPEDEEESAMREMKEREMRRRKDEEARLLNKAKEDAEEAAKLAQVQDQTKNKQFTYDSDGNLIWVQPVNVSKLPATNPAPSVAVKKDQADAGGADPAKRKRTTMQPRKSEVAKPARRREEGFQDSFKRFASQQPKMMDSMSMSPGVVLEERGKAKGGGIGVTPRTMTRKEYTALLEKGATGYGAGGAMSQHLHTLGDLSEQEKKEPSMDIQPTEVVKAKDPAVVRGDATAPVAAPAEPQLPPLLEPPEDSAVVGRTSATASQSPRARSRGGGGPGMKIVRAPVDLGTELLGVTPHPPSVPRPMQPAPPLEIRRAMKQQALGHAASARERLPSTTPTPRLIGSPMGQRLMSASMSDGDRFDSPRIAEEARTPRSAQSPHGQIVSKNPDLVKRLFLL